jgi:crotonobetainyl-CoA:carnitine CoA-transferase CaiB-like acyl-CoA transferase
VFGSENAPAVVLGTAIKLSGQPPPDSTPRVPMLGEDTITILKQVGIHNDEIERLRRDGVI